MADEVGFVTMAGARATTTAPEVGIGMLGYAFMGKAHTNAYKKIPYMIYPPPAVPKLVAIAGRDEAAVKETQGFTDVLVTEAYHPFWSNWWPHGHIIGWEHTFVHEIAHLLDAIVNNKEVAPYGATFEDGYRNAVICDAIVQSSLEGRRIAIEY
jgi:predicted dehydrogenase